ncbi:unnamed protein product [Ascophyllum nodosum]
MTKARQGCILRPLSLAVTALVRSSMGLRHAHSRLHVVHSPCFSVLPSCSSLHGSSASKCARVAEAQYSHHATDARKAARWDIPWGNPETKRQQSSASKYTLTRTLQTLPGEEPHSDDSSEGTDSFRVMSFNILAQALATSKMFTYVPKGKLKKHVRWPRVRDEVCRYGADIICLQECDAFNAILTALRKSGESQGSRFEGIYKRRSGVANGHGVAIFFDSKVFRLLDSGTCELGEELLGMVSAFALLQDRRRHRPSRDSSPPHPRPAARAETESVQPNNLDTLTDQGGNRMASVERAVNNNNNIYDGIDDDGGDKEEGTWGAEIDPEACGMVCVVTTHLYWHPQGSGIRLAQAEALMQKVETFLRERFGDGYSSVPVVLAGDLNNVPGVDVYRLLLTGACQGETPEAFAGRRKERDAARMAKRLEEFRKAQKAAGNMAAKQAAVRRKNAALIAAASSAAKGTKGSAQVPCPEKSVVCVADRVGAVAHKLPAKLAVSVSDVGGVSAKEDYSEGDGASLDDVLEATGREEEFHVLAGGDAPEVRRDAASDSMDTNSGGDVQNYTQTFKGLRSAYSAYSSVFASQLSKEFHALDALTCKTTGRVTVGHLQLGSRSAAGAEDVADLSSGEPQLTTCTDKFAGTLDYIWHTPQLSVRALLDLPTLEEAMKGGGLPTMTYPSDHVSIMAQLRWRNQSDAINRDTPSRQ